VSKYYQADVNKAMLQEYLDILNTPKSNAASDAIGVRKAEIREYLFAEVFSQFAHDHAPERPELEVIECTE
jgi:hypothetical protein